MSSDVQPGWYPDPDGKPAERYWDGDKWTEQTRPQTVKKSQPKKNGDYVKREKSRYDGLIGWSIIIIIGLIFFSCVTSDDDGETTSTPVVQESNNAEAVQGQTEALPNETESVEENSDFSVGQKLASIDGVFGEYAEYERRISQAAERCDQEELKTADQIVLAQQMLDERGQKVSLIEIIEEAILESIPPSEIGTFECSEVIALYIILRTN